MTIALEHLTALQ